MDDSAQASPSRQRMGQVLLGRLVTACVVLAVAVGYLAVALTMPVGTVEQPGPAVFPIGVGIVAIASCLLVIGESLFAKQGRGVAIEWPRGERLRLLAVFAAVTVAYVVALPLLGQYIASALYLSAMLIVIGRMRWWLALLAGTAIAVAITFAFTELLGVNLPSGIW